TARAPAPPTDVRTDHSDRFALAKPPPKSNASERQKIITLRIVALGDARWSGQKLLDAFEMQGLAFGRYQVFHRNHADGRSLFCVASLVEPGTFDLERMPDQEFRGLSCFAVLPGPLEPLQTYEALIATARRLAESLTGMVQDGRGLPLSPQRAASLRDEVAQFGG
ncbi:MAG: cell division protein ZipA C-terminal FtsZ-binding domain-containing protein, partial [Gammaproteobacteria bacterium]|nr:cell division protein ZipA C-terminal FtsZ-binding domain-containing protein [Gammaproteobacteria bacterium]